MKAFRVDIVNLSNLGHCYSPGEGDTPEEAREEALRLARERDPRAEYDEGSDQVHIHEEVRL